MKHERLSTNSKLEIRDRLLAYGFEMIAVSSKSNNVVASILVDFLDNLEDVEVGNHSIEEKEEKARRVQLYREAKVEQLH